MAAIISWLTCIEDEISFNHTRGSVHTLMNVHLHITDPSFHTYCTCPPTFILSFVYTLLFVCFNGCLSRAHAYVPVLFLFGGGGGVVDQVQAKEGPAFLKAMALFMEEGRRGRALLPPAAPPASASGGMSYKDAGVDIDAGNSLVERIKPACKSTRRAGCDSDLGGFGGLFDLAAAGYDGKDTILVGATDGVGTKLKV